MRFKCRLFISCLAVCHCAAYLSSLNCFYFSDNLHVFSPFFESPNVNSFFAFFVDLSHLYRTPVCKPHYVKWRNLGIFLWIMWITLCITDFTTFFIPFLCGKNLSFSTAVDSTLFSSTYFLCNFHNLPFSL